MPHTLLGNNGGIAGVGSMTPNVGGFAGRAGSAGPVQSIIALFGVKCATWT